MVVGGRAIEMIAEEARQVIEVIGRLTGEIRSDEILTTFFPASASGNKIRLFLFPSCVLLRLESRAL